MSVNSEIIRIYKRIKGDFIYLFIFFGNFLIFFFFDLYFIKIISEEVATLNWAAVYLTSFPLTFFLLVWKIWTSSGRFFSGVHLRLLPRGFLWRHSRHFRDTLWVNFLELVCARAVPKTSGCLEATSWLQRVHVT